MIKSAIEWTDTTWSPVIGCHKVFVCPRSDLFADNRGFLGVGRAD